MVEMQDSLQFDNEKDFKRGLGAGKGINGTLESRSPEKQNLLQKENDPDDGYDRSSSGAHIEKMKQSASNNPAA